MTDVAKIDSLNTIYAAFDDAKARASVVFKSNDTLIDQIKAKQWDSWDESKEIANVGKGSVSNDDEIDIEHCEPTAA